jgi:hypothetical protein
LHIGDEVFDSVQVGEMVKVEIKKSRFQVNDPYILSVGVFHGLGKKGPVRRPVAVTEEAAPVVGEEALDEEAVDEETEETEEAEQAEEAEETEEAEAEEEF